MYRWNEEKNALLLSHIEKYPNQYIYVIALKGYIHYVPYLKDVDYIFLKNIIPSRKLNKQYKGV